MTSRSISANELRTQILKRSREWKDTPLPFAGSDLAVEGDLDLGLVDLDCPLEFVNCTFQGKVQLPSTRVRALAFRDCVFKATFVLDYAQVASCLELTGAQATAGLCLSARGAVINGDVL